MNLTVDRKAFARGHRGGSMHVSVIVGIQIESRGEILAKEDVRQMAREFVAHCVLGSSSNISAPEGSVRLKIDSVELQEEEE